jgi:hypothetical protein
MELEYELPSIHRSNISRRKINRKNKRTKLSLELQATSICKHQLSEEYIHNSFKKFDGGYVYYDRDEDGILGFCLWKKYTNETMPRLHILLLCSKNANYSLGKTMLEDIEYYCLENKIPSITLNPATDDLYNYYKKYGFRMDIEPKDKGRMIKNIEVIHVARKRHNKTRRIPMSKRMYPMIASTMPMDLNTEKLQNY